MTKSMLSDPGFYIVSPKQDMVVSQHIPLQYDYAYGKCLEPTMEGWKEKRCRDDRSRPAPITVRWKNPFEKECTLFLAEDEKFSKAQSWKSKYSKKLYNLLPGKRYFLKVVCGKFVTEKVSFETALHLPRFICVPGVTNVRDLGGWVCEDGKKKIRFSMIYRGAQHEKWNCASGITKEGKRVLLQNLKLNSVLDLRWWDEGKKVLGEDVKNYVKLPVLAYATWHGPTKESLGIFSSEQKKHVRQIFEFLSKKSSYPVYFHCQGGGDRTGTIAFLLEVVLGIKKEIAEKEYELSNLSNSGIRLRSSEVWTLFMEKLETYAPGKGILEQVTAYLYECGVTEKTLEKIRENLLEEV